VVTKLVTDLKVSPSDWLTNPSSINSPWQIWYRYRGKLVKVMGMNKEKNHSSRVELTIQLIKTEQLKLQKYGYNPISKTYLIAPPEHAANSYTDSMGFAEAINLAYSQLKVEHATQLNIKCCIKYVFISAFKVGLADVSIDQVRKGHLKIIMNECHEQRNLSPRNWNAYRTYLMMLFEQLAELDIVDHNPAKELKKKSETIKIRTTLTSAEREKVKSYLKINYPVFYRFIQIFFHSGGRRTELLSLKVKDVDLYTGEYCTLVKKGKQKRMLIRVIKNVAAPYWKEQLCNANQDDYVFSVGLLSGPHKIREEQVTRRWKVHVKDKLNISADLYSLKHLNTDETASLLNINAAAAHNGHTTTKITQRYYAQGEEQRMRERLRQLKNPL